MPEPAMLDYFYGDEAEQYTFCVRNFKKMTRNQKRCSKGAVKRPLSISFSVRIFFTSYTNLENETACP